MGLFDHAKKALFGKHVDDAPAEKPGRNDPCWCGSNNKYKKCHLPEDEKKAAKSRALNCGPT